MTTRIWFENDAIQVDDLGAFPARSLFTIMDTDRVHVLTLSGVRLMQLVYTGYARKDGSGFGSASAAQTYLDGEFGRAPIGASDTQIESVVDSVLSDVPDFALQFDSAAT